jgi:hypothetical protein
VIDGDRPNFQKLVQKYREYRSITSIQSKTSASYRAFKAMALIKGAFKATLNGQNKDSEAKPLRKCLCGELHRLIECPYLFIEVHEPGWNPKPEVEEKVREALVNPHKGLKKGLKRAKAKLEKRVSTFITTPDPMDKPGNFAA